jgi:hypothetical protein
VAGAASASSEQAGTTISPAEDGSPLTIAKVTGAELLRSLRAEADRITALGAGLRERIDTLTDPTAAEAEVEAVRAARRAARLPDAEGAPNPQREHRPLMLKSAELTLHPAALMVQSPSTARCLRRSGCAVRTPVIHLQAHGNQGYDKTGCLKAVEV